MIGRPPRSPLFPYTPLSRSRALRVAAAGDADEQRTVDPDPDEKERRDRQERAEQGIDARDNRQEVREVHPQHHEVALREVDDAHDPEDQGQADAHERVDAAHEQARHHVLREVADRHDAATWRRARWVSWWRTPPARR